ncbi:P-loop containing nucleoside triphosphate hydrolase protein [Pisolithus croceorrhizus]|nr:P-loop containing nucleoside triphosphate hydrolase protein [Pisolithus croceorrhizus]KAI6169815.1 P-loop containing nucleoside triphosphate hydrolase protein [Pisolithus thermaeus]
MSDQRTKQLHKRFNDIIHGNVKLEQRSKDCHLFLQGLCEQGDPAKCANDIVANPPGLPAVQQAMRSDLRPNFLNGLASDVLEFLLRAEMGGDVLNKVIVNIVDPPIFWNEFHMAFENGTLNERAQRVFVKVLSYLLQMPNRDTTAYRQLAGRPSILDKITNSSQEEVRSEGYLIKHILSTAKKPSTSTADPDFVPGGRHDNDFLDFREIAILPTADELTSTKKPALRPASLLEDPEGKETRVADYLDNTFRLLRDDMMHELKEDIDIALKKKQERNRGLVVDGIKVVDIYTGPDNRRIHWGLKLQCGSDFPALKDVKEKDRKQFFLDDHRGSRMLRHQSLACLIGDGAIMSLGTIHRDEDLLAKKPPIIVFQIEGQISLSKALMHLKKTKQLRLIQIDCAVFAFEPVLKALQRMPVLPLSEEILFWEDGKQIASPPVVVTEITGPLSRNPSVDLKSLLQTPNSIILDVSQVFSLLAGLKQKLSLIQGPPGTGKSFIGALLAKALHMYTSQTILVVCYTNHALDQFLEDLIGIGIPREDIVRFGGRAKPALEDLSVFKMQRERVIRSKAEWTLIDEAKQQASHHLEKLQDSFTTFKSFQPSHETLLTYVEFEDPRFFDAFCVPDPEDMMKVVGPKGKAVDNTFLISRWMLGLDAGVFKDEPHVRDANEIWNMDKNRRQLEVEKWKLGILKQVVEDFCVAGEQYNYYQDDLSRKFGQALVEQLKTKRIIGCTTTGAAKFAEDIRAASPDVLLVEEAGEILESHVITALSSTTSQMILIGDHKQLRPKVNNYTLTVEKGEGYDLNRSLFERLVLKGFPHVTLSSQHRMRPEISALIRALTYPDLKDAPKTKNRDNIRGVQSNVIFVNHSHPEDEDKRISDRADGGSTSSKQNTYEVKMVLRIVRYLAQQGYGSENIVILTPYLGQLSNLRDALKNETDPILNDLDSNDLSKAGLLTDGNSKKKKTRIRLATIDNYQGEESDIVVASLCRSNSSNSIGFMDSPERLNVLISRARNGLILIGNAATFECSKKGGKLWTDFLDLMRKGGYVFGGFPVKCEKHPDKKREIAQPDDFDAYTPDGGCTEPCGTMLKCNVHPCTLRCHPLRTAPNQPNIHTTMLCKAPFSDKCLVGAHTITWLCHEGRPSNCKRCDKETKRLERQAIRDLKAKEDRETAQREHDLRMLELEAKLQFEREALTELQKAKDRENEARQKEKEIEDLKQKVKRAAARRDPQGQADRGSQSQSQPQSQSNPPSRPRTPSQDQSSGTSQPTNQNVPRPKLGSAARDKWEYQKRVEGVQNDAIDKIMDMTGLEGVKEQVLRIKAKIDTTKRQGVALDKERFNLVLLGNPGTGKTTVARLYAQFLESIQVLPGDAFLETTGSSLANDGVSGAKKLVDDALKAGGGAIFIDEAYQLVSDYDQSGRPVLDYLLAEMENRVGTLVFILAGYTKEMEKFFEHNPGIPSRVPYSLQFADYTDAELLTMLEDLVLKRYKGRMQVEDGVRGLYARIAVKRLGRGRGRPGFGNARALQNMFAKICERQAERVQKARTSGMPADDFFMSKEDMIGPNPSKVLPNSAAWAKLQSLTGLESVKDSVRNFFALIETNYQRELDEKEPMAMSLNRVFLGSPGTGKTTVAQLYGKILAELGLLSNGEVVVKNPADFVGGYLGHSEKNTKAILSSTMGKVLVIDEAYMLYGKSSGNQDSFKTAVIDTMVAEIQSVPGEDRCVLLLGYKQQMEEMFQNVNPGLARRFAIENAFTFEDFTEPQLMQILDFKLKSQDLSATDDAKRVAKDLLSRMKNRPNFGNAGEVENLLGLAKARYQKRMATVPAARRAQVTFEPQDFDPDHNRDQNASTNLAKLFEDVVGCDDVIKKLEDYQKIARAMKAQGLDMRTQIPSNFIFKGPPGTGKTSTARKLGQVYYDMGFLSSAMVVECSASDLVGQYVGQTGPKTKGVFEKALGKVLFVDEAYRLSEGHFTKEAMDEIVGLMTQERYMNKLIIILAGYEEEMNALLQVNPGLSSRFAEEIAFQNMTSDQCLTLLDKDLRKNGIVVTELKDPSSAEYPATRRIIESMSSLPSWGNARDMKTIGKRMVQKAFSNAANNPGQPASLSIDEAVTILKSTLEEKRKRQNVPTLGSLKKDPSVPPTASMSGPAPPPPPTSTSTNTSTQGPKPPPPPPRQQESKDRAPKPPRNQRKSRKSPATPDESSRASSPGPSQPETVHNHGQKQNQANRRATTRNDTGPSPSDCACRDPGVSDRVWAQLQAAKAAEEERKRKAIEEERRLQQDLARVQREERLAEIRRKKLEEERVRLAEQATLAEEARRREAAVRAARDRAAAELRKKQEEEERKRREELARRLAEIERQAAEARRREQEVKAARERAAEELKRKQKEEAERQRKIEEAQKRLKRMGVCVMGFQWIHVGSGWRCSAGGHFISDAQLGMSGF